MLKIQLNMKTFYFLLFVLILFLMYLTCSKKNYIKNNNNSNIKPQICEINNFLSDIECNNIISFCKKYKNDEFKKSSTTNGQNKNFINNFRTSETISFKNGENLLIDSIKNKVSKKFKIRKKNMESIQITRYTKNQEYKYHYDYFLKDVKNQRKYTILIYLNSLNENDGGSTTFLYGKSFQPVIGKLLKWSNTDKNGNKNTNTLHCGEPILSDVTKYILTIWTRCKSLKNT